MARAGLRKVVKTAKGGVRRAYYVKSNPQPLQNLRAYKAKGGTSAASRGAKIGAFAGAVVGGTLGTVGGALLGGAARHSTFKSAVRAADPWAGVGRGNDPRFNLLVHRPGMVTGHYARGVAAGGGAGGLIGAGGGAAAGAVFGAGIGKLIDRSRARSRGLRQDRYSDAEERRNARIPVDQRSRPTPPGKGRAHSPEVEALIRQERQRRDSR